MHTQKRIPAARAAALALSVAAAGLALPATAAQAATASVTCGTGVWKATYYANTTFAGTAKKTACDTAISENYGTGDPAGVTLPKDNFGVRWTVTRDFGSGGPFSFAASAQDGIRVYLDGTRKINLWKDYTSTQKKTVNVTVPKGKHTIRVDFAAFKGKANVAFAYAPRTSASVDKVKPLAPTALKGTVSGYTSQLSWAKNAELDLAGYRVYRNGGLISGSSLLTKPAYTDTPPPTGAKYAYTVTAVDKAGNASAKSAAVTLSSVDKTAPAVPAGLTVAVSADGKGYDLAWTSVADATRYTVYRATSATGTYSSIGTTYTASYTDTKAAEKITYYYAVAATDAAANLSAKSVPVGAGTTLTVLPATIQNVTATLNSSATWFTLNWSIPAADWTGDMKVYASKTSPVPLDGNEWCTPYRESNLGAAVAKFSCTPNASTRGATYYIAVVQVDDDGDVSLPAEISFTTPGDEIAPAAVTGLTAEATNYGIALDWDDSPDSDLQRYVVYRGTIVEDDEDGAHFITEGYQYVSGATSEFVYPLEQDGETWTFLVDAVDVWGNSLVGQRKPIPYVTVTELNLTPTVETPSGSPVDLDATAASSGTGVDLDWSSVTDAVSYRVYRWNPATSAYERLTTDPDPLTATAWTDTTAASGTTHYYWVTAVYADGTESAPGADYAIVAPATN
jgi:fibronectin type 3 domain-containing protein